MNVIRVLLTCVFSVSYIATESDDGSDAAVRVIYSSFSFGDQGVKGSAISFEYTLPLIFTDEGEVRPAYDTFHPVSKDELQFLLAHERSLDQVHTDFGDLSMTVGFRYDCLCGITFLNCTAVYTKNFIPILIYHNYNKPKILEDNSVVYNFHTEITYFDDDGERLLSTPIFDLEKWRLFHNFSRLYTYWKPIDSHLTKLSHVDEMKISLNATTGENSLVMCTVISRLPVIFKLILTVPGANPAMARSMINSEKNFVARAGVHAHITQPVTALCEIKSSLGWIAARTKRIENKIPNGDNLVSMSNNEEQQDGDFDYMTPISKMEGLTANLLILYALSISVIFIFISIIMLCKAHRNLKTDEGRQRNEDGKTD